MSSNMLDHYRVAAIQFEPLLGAKAENIARLLALTAAAAQAGAQLIVLPEMATTGYCWYDRAEIRPHVEPIPGPTTAAFSTLGQQFDCYIVIGMPEVVPSTGIFYNSAVLVGPAGVVGTYRKTHSFAADLKWAKDGDLGLPVWETPLGRIGIMICMDAGYFEPARLLALSGADLMCFPTNWLGEKSPGPAWMARAWENGCYLIAANRYGLERGTQFSGGSCVLNPDGTIQAMQDTGDGIVYGEVSLPAARAKSWTPYGSSEKLAARHPELYDNLTLNCYLWEPMEFHNLYEHRPLPPARRSQIAVVQFAPLLGLPAANLAQIEHALAELRDLDRTATGGLDLVVFPEYALTGCPTAERTTLALLPDEATSLANRLVDLARLYALNLVISYAERLDEHIFSTTLLLGPDGIVARYRKTHIVGTEAAWCTPGTDPPAIIDLPLGRVGLLLGTDLCFPEIARSLAIAGCDLLVVPSGPGMPPTSALGPTAVSEHHFHLARQRAVENNCYLAFASLPSPDGIGCSAVFGPDPEDRAQETILPSCITGLSLGTIDTTNCTDPYPALARVRTKELVRMRQPHLYDLLQFLFVPGN